MKEDWEVKKLGEVIEIRNGKNQKEVLSETGQYPIMGSAGNVMGYATDYICEAGTTIIGRKGNISKPIFIGEKFWNVDTAFGLYPKNNLSEKFVYYTCLNIDFGSMNRGTTIPSLVKTELLQIPILVPKSLPEQERIVAILDEAFAAIAKAKANAEQNLMNAKELFESFLQGVFENENWGKTSIKNEIELIVGFAFKSKGYTELQDDILLVRGDNIMQGYFRWDDAKRWTKAEYSDLTKYQLQENDILLAMDRPWVKAGLKIARISKAELPALLVQRTACLRTKEKLDNTFLFHLMNSNRFMKYLVDVQTGIGVPHISGQQILDFEFRKPSVNEQQSIVQKLDALSVETKRLEAIYEKKIEDLAELKKTILQKAFNGELGHETTAIFPRTGISAQTEIGF